MKLSKIVVWAIIAALPVTAWSQSQETENAVDIPPEEWRAMTEGRTLTYRINGVFWALEHYHTGTNRVTLELENGECMDGTWEYQAPVYCFNWESAGTSCFRHARKGSEVLIIAARDKDDEPQDIQNMTNISDIPLNCSPAVTS